MRYRYYQIDDTDNLYKASALYKVLDNMGNFLCNVETLKEARKKAKQSQGKIYKILQNEFVENIFEELWEDYSIPKYKGRK